MYGGMPPLVDRPQMIPPPGAVTGGQPLAGYQQGYRQSEPAHSNWLQSAAGHGTPWANGGASAPWGNTPGASWANTPAQSQGHSPWPQQQQHDPYQQPAWPRQGWGPAAQPSQGSRRDGGNGWANESTPWDWPQAPPSSAPGRMGGGNAHGFSAMAAPPPELGASSSGQPIGATSWFAQGAGAGTPRHAGGGWREPRGWEERGWEEDDDDEYEFYDYEAEEAREAAAAWSQGGHTPGWGQGGASPGWGQAGGRGRGQAGGQGRGQAGAQGWGEGEGQGWRQGEGQGWGQGEGQGWGQGAGQGWGQGEVQGGGQGGWGQQHGAWSPADTRGAWGEAWPHDPLARSQTTRGRSKSPHRKSGKGRKRANSFGGGGTLPGWGVPVPNVAMAYDEHNLAPRPEDWREGYSPRGSAAADLSLSSLFRRTTLNDTSDFVDTKKRKLADPLVFSATRPGIAYDIRRSADTTRAFGPFKPRNASDLMQPAVTPAATRMRLVHPRLPWYVDVRRMAPQGGVTLYDVLRSLYDELDRPIASRDFFNEELGKKDRDGLTKAFKERCNMNGKEYAKAEMLKGVKRIDYLGAECVFVGLVKRNGLWEIKTERDH